MSTPAASRLIRQTARFAARSLARPVQMRTLQTPVLRQGTVKASTISHPRWLSTSRTVRAGLMPDTEEPQPPPEDTEAAEPPATQPTEISDDEYHARADEFMETVSDKAEQLQESREDVEVEFSAGVLNITFPPNGTYVLNKQPPNKQLWLSSPLSGPKRFDWVLASESMDHKEGSGTGEWVYLRDGTNLSALLQKELGLIIDSIDQELAESRDPTE